ncbi:MAG TPA: hypothetical protein VGN20_08380 [Mucilaginibacter sp.]|jgi:hypothetical protein
MKTYFLAILMLVFTPALFADAPKPHFNYSLKLNSSSLDISNGFYKNKIDLLFTDFYDFGTLSGAKAPYNYTLENFTAVKVTADSSQVKITWMINDESNYCFYTAERSNDAGKTFSKIEKIQGCGHRQYIVFDRHPAPGQNIYRLKLEQDASDPVVYSSTVTVKYSDVTLSSMNKQKD